jgi:hypothetical protein
MNKIGSDSITGDVVVGGPTATQEAVIRGYIITFSCSARRGMQAYGGREGEKDSRQPNGL